MAPTATPLETTGAVDPTKRICTQCKRCLPIDEFCRVQKGREKRRSVCSECRVGKELHRRTKAVCSDFRNFMREARKSRPGRMTAIVESMIDWTGGANAFVNRWLQLYENGTDSFRKQTELTIVSMELAEAKLAFAEKELLIERIRSGMADREDLADGLERLGDEQVLDAACESVRALMAADLLPDLLPDLLRRMKKRGWLAGERLAVGWSGGG